MLRSFSALWLAPPLRPAFASLLRCGRFRRLRLAFHDRRREIRGRRLPRPLAELVAQHPGRYFGDRAFLKLAQLEGTERHANEPPDLQPEMAQHVAPLAVLAFADRKRDPHVGGLLTVEHRVDRSVIDAVHRHALPLPPRRPRGPAPAR